MMSQKPFFWDVSGNFVKSFNPMIFSSCLLDVILFFDHIKIHGSHFRFTKRGYSSTTAKALRTLCSHNILDRTPQEMYKH